MDENLTGVPLQPAPDDGTNKTESDVPQSDQVFDINSDLTIAPANYEAEAPHTQAEAAALSREIANALKTMAPEPASSAAATVAAADSSSPAISMPVTEKPSWPVTENLSPPTSAPTAETADKPAQVQPQPANRFAPASPPAKTVTAPEIIIPQSPKPTLDSLSRTLGKADEEAEKNLGLKRLRTYEGDVAELMSRRKTSVAQIAIAEEKRSTGSEMLSNTPTVATAAVPAGDSHALRNALITIVSLLLVGGGLVAGYYLYTQSLIYIAAPKGPAPQNTMVASLVRADTQVTLMLNSASPARILTLIQAEAAHDQKPGTIKEIIPLTTSNGVTVRVSATDMIDLLKIPAPDVFARSLTDSWMLGIYSDQYGHKSGFVIVTNNFFQNAFAGMLSWEQIMPDDLRQYFYAPGTAPSGITNGAPLPTPTALSTAATLPIIASSTAPSSKSTAVAGKKSVTGKASTTSNSTKTAPLSPPPPVVMIAPAPTDSTSIRGQFRDRIIQNKDVREFVTSQGDVLFLYSFIDSSRLIVAGSEAALTEVLSRLESSSFVR